MVKVQKPTPKTLSKIGKVEKAVKKQKLDKKSKLKQIKSPVFATEPKTIVLENSKAKAKFLQNTGKQGKSDELVNNPKKKKELYHKVEQKITAKSTKLKQENKKPKGQKAPLKRPLVLAPPESPNPTPNSNIGIKLIKYSNTVTPPIVPNADVSKTNKQLKEQKNATAADISSTKKKANLSKLQKTKRNKAVFQRRQNNSKTKKEGKTKKKPHPKIFEPVPFNEDKFYDIVNVANIKNVGKALKTLVEKEVADKKRIFSDYRYCLNVASIKIPSCPKRMVKLYLKHSLVDKDDDIVIVVPDLRRGAKVDYEPTIHHYEDLFREAGIEGLKIMPFNQLRTECNTFETVRKFGNTYDYFLCDGRLVGQVAGFCGKIFQKPRTTFHSVRMDNPKNLKNEIEKSLRRTAYKQLHKGDLITIPVGSHKFTMQQLAENVEHVVSQLKQSYPGGLSNVRNMHLKIDMVGTSSLPIYVSIGQEVPIETPYVVGPREQRMLKLRKEANAVLSKFNLTKDAQLVKLNRKQLEIKSKVKEMRAALLQDVDCEDPAVPAKKPRQDEHKSDADKKGKNTLKEEKNSATEGKGEEEDEDEPKSDEEEAGENEDDEDDDENEGDEDDDEDEDDEDDDENDDDEEEDDDEDGDSNGDGDDDDDEEGSDDDE